MKKREDSVFSPQLWEGFEVQFPEIMRAVFLEGV